MGCRGIPWAAAGGSGIAHEVSRDVARSHVGGRGVRRNPVWDVVGSLEIPLDGNSPENSPKSPIVNRNLILWVALHLQYYKDGQRVQTKSSAGYTPEYQVVGIKV